METRPKNGFKDLLPASLVVLGESIITPEDDDVVSSESEVQAQDNIELHLVGRKRFYPLVYQVIGATMTTSSIFATIYGDPKLAAWCMGSGVAFFMTGRCLDKS